MKVFPGMELRGSERLLSWWELLQVGEEEGLGVAGGGAHHVYPTWDRPTVELGVIEQLARTMAQVK